MASPCRKQAPRKQAEDCVDFDVIIIGSGPAGGRAAIECAKAGLKTALFEKEPLPRRKVCAGGLVKRALKHLPDDFDLPYLSRCHTVEIHVQRAQQQFRETRENLITMVSRVDFDYALVQHAAKFGAQILQETPVLEVLPGDEFVEIVTDTERHRASYLIFAEGANARLSNQFWPDDRVLIPSLESEVFLSSAEMARYAGVARFDFDVLPSGYGWLFPKGDHVSVGIASFANKNEHLQKLFDAYKATVGVPPDALERNRRGYIIPIKPRQGPMMKQRMLLVGDAAGFADPVTAEGFSYALKSGLEAGKAIVRGRNPEEVATLYQAGIERDVVQELNVASKCAKPFYASATLRKLIIKKHGMRLCRGMVGLIEGDRSYGQAVASQSALVRYIAGYK